VSVLQLRRGRTSFTSPDGDEWMAAAICRGMEPAVFFGPDGGRAVEETWAPTAKVICGTCTVRRACLDYALTERLDDGVFGGLTPSERRRLRVARGLA
jgi:WhiB family transcriptional regulator, redox-sensing transcriptional regulator